jgi:hypothetical protein
MRSEGGKAIGHDHGYDAEVFYQGLALDERYVEGLIQHSIRPDQLKNAEGYIENGITTPCPASLAPATTSPPSGFNRPAFQAALRNPAHPALRGLSHSLPSPPVCPYPFRRGPLLRHG